MNERFRVENFQLISRKKIYMYISIVMSRVERTDDDYTTYLTEFFGFDTSVGTRGINERQNRESVVISMPHHSQRLPITANTKICSKFTITATCNPYKPI